MKVLTYSPSVEAYALVGQSRTAKDLSPDIVSCTVGRKTDAASEFSITLQNKNFKYNGVFQPFDPIVIFATKTKQVKLFTGYITTMDAFTLYQGDFKISGLCPIYRVQQTYWDPGLLESQKLMWADAYMNGESDNGYAAVAVRLLTKVGNWPSSMIYVQDSIPDEAFQLACDMYEANRSSMEQLKDRTDEFYEILQTHGPKITATTTTGGSGDGSGGDGGAGESGGLSLSGDEAKASADQRKIVSKATSGTVAGSGGMCLQWVNDVYQAAGFPFARYWGAIEVWRHRKDHKAYGSGKTGIPIGACVVTTGSGSGGAGHIGIYIGNGNVISEVGGQRTETVEAFGSWASDSIDGMTGWCGWVAPDCGATWS